MKLPVSAFISGIALAASLAACASAPTVYQAAARPGGPGYAESPIESDRWRVSFRGGAGAGAREVEGLAIRRAAELTLAKGYDWFSIAGRETDSVSGASGVAVSLEILMGRGQAPPGDDVYDARAIRRGLGAPV